MIKIGNFIDNSIPILYNLIISNSILSFFKEFVNGNFKEGLVFAKMKISVVGCGRWGSLITWYLAEKRGLDVTLYGRFALLASDRGTKA